MCDANHFIVKGKDTYIMTYFVITIDKQLEVVFGVSVRITNLNSSDTMLVSIMAMN